MDSLVRHTGETRKTYKILVKKSERNKQFEGYGQRPLKLNYRKTESEVVCWSHLAEDTVHFRALVIMVNSGPYCTKIENVLTS
jgi:hypothetical protein